MYYETWIWTTECCYVPASEQMATGKIPYSDDAVRCYVI